MDPDFNSSDVEFDPLPPSKFAQAGRASIEKLIENAFNDRIASKRAVKQLTWSAREESTEYKQQLWWNRFNDYLQGTLGLPATTTPTGEHIERFLVSIVGKVKPLGGPDAVPSRLWLVGGCATVVRGAIFHHAGFKLSPNERVRIAGQINSLEKSGQITDDAKRERNWATVCIVRIIVRNILEDAFHRGTSCWDGVLSRVTSMVIVASTGCRVGDTTKRFFATQALPFLAYQDVTIRLIPGGSSVQDLECVLTLRNEKFKTKTTRFNRKVVLKSLSQESTLIDPIALILVMALRTGNVKESGIDDLINNLQLRANRTVQWVDPLRPVVCALTNGQTLVVDKPASALQLNEWMQTASLRAGLLRRYRPHDMRRGHSREVAHLPAGQLLGGVNTAVAASVGHGVDKGRVTAQYIGDLGGDVWSMRVANPIKDDPVNPIERVQEGFVAERLSKEQIDSICTDKGFNKDERADRKKAAALGRKQQQDDWLAQQQQSQWQSLESESPKQPRNKRTKKNPADDIQSTVSNEDDALIDPRLREADAGDSLDLIGEDVVLDAQSQQEVTRLQEIMEGSYDSGFEDGTIDDIVMTGLEQMSVRVDGHTGADQGASKDVVDSMAMGLDLIRSLSTINFTTKEYAVTGRSGGKRSLKYAQMMETMNGNSRNPVTAFRHPCVYRINGCNHTSDNAEHMRKHEKTCVASKPTKPFPCSDCSRSYETQEQLDHHVYNAHTQVTCHKPPCNGLVTIGSRNLMAKHNRETHKNIDPMNCKFPLCTHPRKFDGLEPYKTHLRKVHGLNGKTWGPYLPKKDG